MLGQSASLHDLKTPGSAGSSGFKTTKRVNPSAESATDWLCSATSATIHLHSGGEVYYISPNIDINELESRRLAITGAPAETTTVPDVAPLSRATGVVSVPGWSTSPGPGSR